MAYQAHATFPHEDTSPEDHLKLVMWVRQGRHRRACQERVHTCFIVRTDQFQTPFRQCKVSGAGGHQKWGGESTSTTLSPVVFRHA